MSSRNWKTCVALFGVLNLYLAAALLSAPWVFGFTAIPDASRNAWICGALIGVVSSAALIAFAAWQDWVLLLVGLWVAASPWSLAFHFTAPTALPIHVALGILVAAFSALQLWLLHSTPPHRPV